MAEDYNSMKSVFARPHRFLDTATSETRGAPGAITVAETGISLRRCRCRGSDSGDIGNTAIRIARNMISRDRACAEAGKASEKSSSDSEMSRAKNSEKVALQETPGTSSGKSFACD